MITKVTITTTTGTTVIDTVYGCHYAPERKAFVYYVDDKPVTEGHTLEVQGELLSILLEVVSPTA